MDFMDRVKSMTREQAARAMVRLITHVSPEAFMKMALLASRIVEDGEAYSAVQAVIQSLKEGEDSQASRMFKRVMTEISPPLSPETGKCSLRQWAAPQCSSSPKLRLRERIRGSLYHPDQSEHAMQSEVCGLLLRSVRA